MCSVRGGKAAARSKGGYEVDDMEASSSDDDMDDMDSDDSEFKRGKRRR